ncbi:MAG: cell division protein FtsZ [Candidatus Alkanophagales archaeon]
MIFGNDASGRDEPEPQLFGVPRIAVVGVGGAGNNTISRLEELDVKGADRIAINTDKLHLDSIKAQKKILIGKALTRGLGTGGDPEVGRKAAEMDKAVIEDALRGKDLVFITAGMGGGTGTGAAPVVAEIAKDFGAIVVAMVSSPFRAERARMKKAQDGIEELKKFADTVIVLDNEKLLQYVPNLPVEEAFKVMDMIIADTVRGITETITQPSLINLDFADLRAVMRFRGIAVMLVGETSKSQNKAEEVVRAALGHPLLDLDYRGAKGSLVHITGGPDLTIKEADDIVKLLTYEIDPDATVIWGARIDENYSGRVKVTAIMTGVEESVAYGRRLEEMEREKEPEAGAPQRRAGDVSSLIRMI